jgi:natural product precursor
MEKKKIIQKLSLNKDVISSLNSSDMNHLRGGYDPSEPSYCICMPDTDCEDCGGTLCDETCAITCPTLMCY